MLQGTIYVMSEQSPLSLKVKIFMISCPQMITQFVR